MNYFDVQSLFAPRWCIVVLYVYGFVGIAVQFSLHHVLDPSLLHRCVSHEAVLQEGNDG